MVHILLPFLFLGQLRDIYGTYDGAFYFAAGAMLTGAAVLTIGNVWKHLDDKAKKSVPDKSVKDTGKA